MNRHTSLVNISNLMTQLASKLTTIISTPLTEASLLRTHYKMPNSDPDAASKVMLIALMYQVNATLVSDLVSPLVVPIIKLLILTTHLTQSFMIAA